MNGPEPIGRSRIGETIGLGVAGISLGPRNEGVPVKSTLTPTVVLYERKLTVVQPMMKSFLGSLTGWSLINTNWPFAFPKGVPRINLGKSSWSGICKLAVPLIETFKELSARNVEL